MKKPIKNILFIISLLLTFLLNPIMVFASDLIITKSFTGGWYDPAKNGQGFLLEIINSNQQKKALTTWFTFDTEGNQFWLIGVGEINDQSIEFQMTAPQGGKFGDLHNSAEVNNQQWGQLTFTFSDCNHGSVSWNPTMTGFVAGSMPITRNTVINNLNCTGGLFDELGDALADSETIVPLVSSGQVINAKGKSKYRQRTDRVDFSVEIEHLPIGTYMLFVGDNYQGDIQVSNISNGYNQGEIEFRDPVEPGKLPLTFDPVGQPIEIIQSGLVYLSSSAGNGSTGGSGNTSNQAPAFGNSETEVFLTNLGVYPLGQAKAKLEQRADRVDFEVELEDIPAGFYDLNVGVATVGVIEVRQSAAGVEGEIEFRNPVEAGKQLLDFNPFGELITVTQGPDMLFSLDFPSTGGQSGNGDDDNGGSNGGDDDNCDLYPNDPQCDDDNGGSNGGDDDNCDSNPNDPQCDDNNGGSNSQNLEIDLEMINTGANVQASGSVEYEIRSDRKDFKVEVEDLDYGTYQLSVGGQMVANLQVNNQEAEVEFRDPVEPGKLPLNFDPLNQLVEVKQNNTVYLYVTVR